MGHVQEGMAPHERRRAYRQDVTYLTAKECGFDLLRDGLCLEPAEYSNSLTAVLMRPDHSADGFRKVVLEDFNLSLGNGLGKLADKVFRIGHLGDFNDLSLIGTLAGVEMGLARTGIPFKNGGVQAANSAVKKLLGEITAFVVAVISEDRGSG